MFSSLIVQFNSTDRQKLYNDIVTLTSDAMDELGNLYADMIEQTDRPPVSWLL